jgi:hypothetical protein
MTETLESKIQTTHDLWLDEEYADNVFEKTQWVPYSEAKTLLDFLNIENNDLGEQLTKANAKIAKANKILDENTPKFNEWGHNYDTYDAKDMYNFIEALREALQDSPVVNKESVDGE